MKKIEILSFLPIKIYICASHTLKNISFHVKELSKKKNISFRTRKFFMFSFSLIQNSKDFNKFENHIKDLFIIFNNRYENDHVRDSFLRIRENILSESLESEIFNFDEAENLILDKHIINQEIKKAIRDNSPFDIYFKKVISDLISSSSSSEKNKFDKLKENQYFCPELFQIINKKLYLYPLWTGHFLPKSRVCRDGKNTFIQYTRATNNAVENWFNQLKNNILTCSKKQNIKKRAYPSEFVSYSYNFLLAKYLKSYQSESNEFTEIKASRQDNEMWSFKKNKKSSFYSNKRNIDRDIDTKSIKSRDYKEIFENGSLFFCYNINNAICN